MELMEAMKGRRSVRKFKTQTIGKDIIEELLNAAQMAPSAGNLQARDFVVVTNKTTKQKLAMAALGQTFIEQAPVAIVAVANIERSSRVYRARGELYAVQDATAGVMNLMLAAQARGLATCWVGAFDESAVREILAIPHRARPVAIIPLGYADEAPAAPPRVGLDKVVHWERW